MPLKYECDRCGKPADTQIEIEATAVAGSSITEYTVLLCRQHYDDFASSVLAVVYATPNQPPEDEEDEE